jgi:hypothetical protein
MFLFVFARVPSMSRCFAIALLVSACGGEVDLGTDAGVDEVEIVGQGSEARADLVVNEVSAKTPKQADWIEIFNRSDAPIDLCGYFVSDSLDRLDHYLHLGGAPRRPAVSRGFWMRASIS